MVNKPMTEKSAAKRDDHAVIYSSFVRNSSCVELIGGGVSERTPTCTSR
jgi:hypothetical protein